MPCVRQLVHSLVNTHVLPHVVHELQLENCSHVMTKSPPLGSLALYLLAQNKAWQLSSLAIFCLCLSLSSLLCLFLPLCEYILLARSRVLLKRKVNGETERGRREMQGEQQGGWKGRGDGRERGGAREGAGEGGSRGRGGGSQARLTGRNKTATADGEGQGNWERRG